VHDARALDSVDELRVGAARRHIADAQRFIGRLRGAALMHAAPRVIEPIIQTFVRIDPQFSVTTRASYTHLVTSTSPPISSSPIAPSFCDLLPDVFVRLHPVEVATDCPDFSSFVGNQLIGRN
jgi:hypothetical protein